MGACLSCLGLNPSGTSPSDPSRAPLLSSSDPYTNTNYTSPPAVPNALSPEEERAQREALDKITRWASDQIVEIFPHQYRNLASSRATGLNGGSGMNGTSALDGPGCESVGVREAAHQDILLNLIPGDKTKRGIRIYRSISRPASREAGSVRSKASSGKLNGKGSGVFVKLDVDLP